MEREAAKSAATEKKERDRAALEKQRSGFASQVIALLIPSPEPI